MIYPHPEDEPSDDAWLADEDAGCDAGCFAVVLLIVIIGLLAYAGWFK